MSLDVSTILKDLLTWGTAIKLAGGAVIHKVWQWIVAKFQTVEADVKKL